ncbi:MAG: hypothetical protein KBS52_02430 [Clostridiales bacterium]|nr:hypothetical protein [Candidatus Equinaster intestinalis]
MRIEEIDKNFAVKEKNEDDEIVWYDIRRSPFRIYGLFAPETEPRFHRLPAQTVKYCNERVTLIENHTAGGRISFKTDSPFIQLKVSCPEIFKMNNMALSGSAGFDVFCRKNGEFSHIYCLRPADCTQNEWQAFCKTPPGTNDLMLYFPLYNAVENVYIGLKKGSSLESGDDYETQKPIVFYGSSITQGAAASRPAMSYEALISHRYNLNYINLGFSGCAHGEKAIAEYIASLDISAFVLDYDHNASGPEHLIKTHSQFYKTIRKAKPDIPIIVVSRPRPIREEMRLVIKQTYLDALESGDKNIAFIDGETLFAGDHYTECTVEGCHPNDLGFYRMSQVIGNQLEKMLNLKKR